MHEKKKVPEQAHPIRTIIMPTKTISIAFIFLISLDCMPGKVPSCELVIHSQVERRRLTRACVTIIVDCWLLPLPVAIAGCDRFGCSVFVAIYGCDFDSDLVSVDRHLLAIHGTQYEYRSINVALQNT